MRPRTSLADSIAIRALPQRADHAFEGARDQVKLTVNGADQPFSLRCPHDGPSVDIVFLIDITGSMRDVIHAVRDSVVRFVDVLEESGVHRTVSVVSLQDSVGVNRTFQQPAPAQSDERSPFFPSVSLDAAWISLDATWIFRGNSRWARP